MEGLVTAPFMGKGSLVRDLQKSLPSLLKVRWLLLSLYRKTDRNSLSKEVMILFPRLRWRGTDTGASGSELTVFCSSLSPRNLSGIVDTPH